MAYVLVCVLLFVVLFLHPGCGANILTNQEYELDELLHYQQSSKKTSQKTIKEELKCPDKTIYIPGFGCIDPTDPNFHPPYPYNPDPFHPGPHQ